MLNIFKTKTQIKNPYFIFTIPKKTFYEKKSIYPNKTKTKKLYNNNEEKNKNFNTNNNYTNKEKTQITYSNLSNEIVHETETSIIYAELPELDHIDNSNPLSEYHKSMEYEDLIFKIAGQENQIAIVDILPGKIIKSESAKLMYMTDGVEMNTSAAGGFFSSIKRRLTGGTIFMTEFTYNFPTGIGRVGFGESYPSKILPIRLNKYGGEIICQKGAFICGSPDTDIQLHTTNWRTGFLGGEGFILQKITGNGICLIKAGGSIIKRQLRDKEKLKIKPGLVIAFENTVNFAIETIGGFNMQTVKNSIGAGTLILATLTGPGTIYIQTMDFDNLVNEISKRLPSRGSSYRSSSGSSKVESSEENDDVENDDVEDVESEEK